MRLQVLLISTAGEDIDVELLSRLKQVERNFSTCSVVNLLREVSSETGIRDSSSKMRKFIAISSLMCLLGLAPASAQVPETPSGLPFVSLSDAEITNQQPLPERPPLALGQFSPVVDRPRLNVELNPEDSAASRALSPSISWSLEAWEVNTASLAHVQCSRATRSIGSFLAEDCRFVDQPLPAQSAGLVQLRGAWTATPGLRFGVGLFGGTGTGGGAGTSVGSRLAIDTLAPARAAPEQIEGVNFNVSFGLHTGAIGNLLLDLQLERQRIRQQPFSSDYPTSLSPLARNQPTAGSSRSYRNTGQLGVQWLGRNFGAGLTGQHLELPQWLGEDLEGQDFRSFDIEFSWRAPARASISVGVSNVLDRLPGAATHSRDQSIEETVDGIYGRIPYVRYKHDL